MSINTITKPATRPAGFTKSEWDNMTFRVYNGLIKLSEEKIIAPQFVNHPVVKELMERCCEAKTPEARWGLFFSLVVHMDNYGTKDGKKVLKIKTIAAMRQWFNGGWIEKLTRPVSYKTPNAPKTPAKKVAKKTPAKQTKTVAPAKKEPKKVQNVSVAQWVKGLTPEQRNELMVEIAATEMDLDSVAC